jgi:hypothetical protein
MIYYSYMVTFRQASTMTCGHVMCGHEGTCYTQRFSGGVWHRTNLLYAEPLGFP